jgi:hypothetical protein
MPADYLSKHLIDKLEDFHDTLCLEQLRDPLCQEITFFLRNAETTPHCSQHYENLIKDWEMGVLCQLVYSGEEESTTTILKEM